MRAKVKSRQNSQKQNQSQHFEKSKKQLSLSLSVKDQSHMGFADIADAQFQKGYLTALLNVRGLELEKDCS